MDFDILEVWRLIKKRLIIIVLCTLVMASITAWLSFYVITPVYEATSKLIIQSQVASNQMMYDDVITNQMLVKTYSEIIKSNKIAEDVILRLGLTLTPEQLLKKVTTKSTDESLITSIIIRDSDPRTAVMIANAYAQSFYENINEIMKIDNVSILDVAKLAYVPKPILPKPYMNIAISIFLTLVVSILLILFLASIDRKIKWQIDVVEILDIPVIGVIPRNPKRVKRYKQISPRGD